MPCATATSTLSGIPRDRLAVAADEFAACAAALAARSVRAGSGVPVVALDQAAGDVVLVVADQGALDDAGQLVAADMSHRSVGERIGGGAAFEFLVHGGGHGGDAATVVLGKDVVLLARDAAGRSALDPISVGEMRAWRPDAAPSPLATTRTRERQRPSGEARRPSRSAAARRWDRGRRA